MKRWELCFVFLLVFSHSSTSEATLWKWFALGPAAAAQPDPPGRERQCSGSRPSDLAKFDIETGSFLSSSRGKDLVEKARHQTAKHSCWHDAYSGLLSSCREILKEEEKKARLAMRLTNCFLKVSERDAIHCPDSVPISKCTSSLSDHTNSIFLAFFIDAASMCHHLQYVILQCPSILFNTGSLFFNLGLGFKSGFSNRAFLTFLLPAFSSTQFRSSIVDGIG